MSSSELSTSDLDSSSDETQISQSVHQKPNKKRSIWPRVLLVLFIIFLFILAVLFYLYTQRGNIVRGMLIGMLEPVFQEELQLEEISFDPFSGKASIHGVTLHYNPDQKEGQLIHYAPAFSMEKLSFDVDLGAFSVGLIHVRELHVSGLHMHAFRDADFKSSLLKLFRPDFLQSIHDGVREGLKQRGDQYQQETFSFEDAQTLQGSTQEAQDLRLRIDKIRIDGVSISLEDQSLLEPWRTAFDGLSIHIDGVRADKSDGLRVAQLAIDLGAFYARQVPGYSEENLIYVQGLSLRSEDYRSQNGTILVSDLSVSQWSANFQRKSENVTNYSVLAALISGQMEAHAAAFVPEEEFMKFKEQQSDQVESVAEDVATSDNMIPAHREPVQVLILKSVDLGVGEFYYRDVLLADEVLDLRMREIHAQIVNVPLQLFSSVQNREDALCAVTAKIDQPGFYPQAELAVIAGLTQGELRPLMGRELRCKAALQLTGFALDTIDPLIPNATREVMGANAVDIEITSLFTGHGINLEGRVKSDKGISYPLSVEGDLYDPQIKTDDVLFGIANRLSGAVVNVGSKAVHVGVDVAKGAGSAVKDVGGGLLRAGKHFTLGVFSTTKGLVSLDGEEMKSGLNQATAGTVKSTVGGVSKAGKSLGGGVGDSIGSIKGTEAQRNWLRAVPQRHLVGVDKACAYALPESLVDDAEVLLGDHQQENPQLKNSADNEITPVQ